MSTSKNISELKDHLSYYLRRVRRGETVLVCDRHQVIARLEPAGVSGPAAAGDALRLEALERRGTIRRRANPLPRGWLARRPKIQADLVAALLADREEGR